MMQEEEFQENSQKTGQQDAAGHDTGTDSILQVQMFGSFQMTWNGKLLSGGSRTSESQFNYLMQMLLHYRQDGVSRDTLERVLFEDRDLMNVHHAMRSVIYNTKKKLQAAGLPPVPLIIQKKGVYRWTDEIAVIEDAEEFEHLCGAAKATEDLQQRLDLCMDAVHAYKGDFLGSQAGVIWAAQEARRYRTLFFEMVEEAAQLLRFHQDFFQLEALGQYASRISPLSDWEALTMEALVSLGRYEEARRLYEETVDLYMREQGLRPSEHMMKQMERLGNHMNHQHAALDEIQIALSEKAQNDPERQSAGGQPRGGYVCTYPVFQGIYQVVERLMERGGQSVYLMLCTIVDSKGNPMKEGPALDSLSERLGAAIQRSVRHSDTINRYGRGQYLVLLVNTTLENCAVVQRRINQNFIVGRQRTGIRYYVNSVICSPERGQPGRAGEIRTSRSSVTRVGGNAAHPSPGRTPFDTGNRR